MPGLLRYIIIDDEIKAQESLKGILATNFKGELECAGTASRLAEGIYLILNHLPDIVFLDIELTSENGLSLFDHFEERSFEVIIISAHKKYGVDAVKSPAIDYLLKPICPGQLRKAIDRFRKIQKHSDKDSSATELITRLNMDYPRDSMIALPTQDGYALQPKQLIIYCEAEQNYTIIHLLGSPSILVSKAIGAVEKMLHESLFFRIHKSYLINLNYLKYYNKRQKLQITLVNGKKLPLAARRTCEFVKTLQEM